MHVPTTQEIAERTRQDGVRLVGGVPQMIVEDHRYKSVPVNQPVRC